MTHSYAEMRTSSARAIAANTLCNDPLMVEWEWGANEQPCSFGLGSSHGVPVYSDQPGDVPEVRAALAQGYFPAPEAPLWCFVPAIWPSEARSWVHDRRVRHLSKQCDAGPLERLPWNAADYADIEHDTNALLAELGLPPRPADRIWLLRAPESYSTTQDVLDDIWAGWQEDGGPAMATPEFVHYAHARLRELF